MLPLCGGVFCLFFCELCRLHCTGHPVTFNFQLASPSWWFPVSVSTSTLQWMDFLLTVPPSTQISPLNQLLPTAYGPLRPGATQQTSLHHPLCCSHTSPMKSESQLGGGLSLLLSWVLSLSLWYFLSSLLFILSSNPM